MATPDRPVRARAARPGLPVPTRRARRPLRLTTWLVALPVALLALVSWGAYDPRVPRAVPYLPNLLAAMASRLPASVAWLHDTGTPLLRPGAYFGWSDGRTGELHLYGEGCSATAGGEVASLVLVGTTGRLEFKGEEVQQLTTDFDLTHQHPHLRLPVVVSRTQHFHRAFLRCRDGTEAHARVTATVQFVPPQAVGPPTNHTQEALRAYAPRPTDPRSALDHTEPVPDGSSPVAVIYGPSAYPGLGLAGEYTLLTADSPLVLLRLAYAPPSAATGKVQVAAGHPAARANWRAAVVAPVAPHHQEPDAGPLGPWHLGYQAADDPRALRAREAADLHLPVHAGEAAMLFLDPTAFRRTPWQRPLLLQPVIWYQQGEQESVLVSPGLAFGWMAPP